MLERYGPPKRVDAAGQTHWLAEEIWKAASGGYTLHQLRHSRLTHLTEAGEDLTMIKAKS